MAIRWSEALVGESVITCENDDLVLFASDTQATFGVTSGIYIRHGPSVSGVIGIGWDGGVTGSTINLKLQGAFKDAMHNFTGSIAIKDITGVELPTGGTVLSAYYGSGEGGSTIFNLIAETIDAGVAGGPVAIASGQFASEGDITVVFAGQVYSS